MRLMLRGLGFRAEQVQQIMGEVMRTYRTRVVVGRGAGIRCHAATPNRPDRRAHTCAARLATGVPETMFSSWRLFSEELPIADIPGIIMRLGARHLNV